MLKKLKVFHVPLTGFKRRLNTMVPEDWTNKEKMLKNSFSSEEGSSSLEEQLDFRHCIKDNWFNGRISSDRKVWQFIKIKFEEARMILQISTFRYYAILFQSKT